MIIRKISKRYEFEYKPIKENHGYSLIHIFYCTSGTYHKPFIILEFIKFKLTIFFPYKHYIRKKISELTEEEKINFRRKIILDEIFGKKEKYIMPYRKSALGYGINIIMDSKNKLKEIEIKNGRIYKYFYIENKKLLRLN